MNPRLLYWAGRNPNDKTEASEMSDMATPLVLIHIVFEQATRVHYVQKRGPPPAPSFSSKSPPIKTNPTPTAGCFLSQLTLTSTNYKPSALGSASEVAFFCFFP